ncbi:hypothetical protein PRZ48_014571 [Zasmidium cellare]|uniref:Uncharacterized protein n=1 Tax=Zasmidium cellare TaxID=395010 RepID=A0ABR0DZ62_ZASCE|nr:hypothetical protein PRZ48_014571 [Zasmidium cellare]
MVRRKPGNTRSIDRQGPDYPLYIAGPESAKYPYDYPLTAGNNNSILPFAIHSVLVWNDALNDMERSAALGYDGFFFWTNAASSPNSESAVRGGPDVVFARATRSKQDRERWRRSNLRTKIQLCCLTLMLHTLPYDYPCHAIWMPKTAPASYTELTRKRSIMSLLPPTQDHVDPTVKKLGTFKGTPGIYMDVNGKRFFCQSVTELKRLLTKDQTYAGLLILKKGSQVVRDEIDALMHKGGKDPVLALLQRFGQVMSKLTAECLPLQTLRTWWYKGLISIDPNTGLSYGIGRTTVKARESKGRNTTGRTEFAVTARGTRSRGRGTRGGGAREEGGRGGGTSRCGSTASRGGRGGRGRGGGRGGTKSTTTRSKKQDVLSSEMGDLNLDAGDEEEAEEEAHTSAESSEEQTDKMDVDAAAGSDEFIP